MLESGDEQVKEKALTWFFHLAGDSHQPLHAKSFVWYSEAGRPELNKALINSYIKFLRESKDEHGNSFSSANINQKLSALRKLASEAGDNNLLKAKIANGIRAVKGMLQRGRRTGNWLSLEEAQMWLNALDVKTLKGIRDRTLLAVLIGGGL